FLPTDLIPRVFQLLLKQLKNHPLDLFCSRHDALRERGRQTYHKSNGHPCRVAVFIPAIRIYQPVAALMAYQRARLGSRRGSRGLASLTVRVRPSRSLPWSPWMAALAAALSGISMKPKPLERPVSRSVITLILSTTPYCSKSWRRS